MVAPNEYNNFSLIHIADKITPYKLTNQGLDCGKARK